MSSRVQPNCFGPLFLAIVLSCVCPILSLGRAQAACVPTLHGPEDPSEFRKYRMFQSLKGLEIHPSIMAVAEKIRAQLPEGFEILVQHPGICYRPEVFIEYAKSELAKEPSLTPLDLFKRYRKHWGMVILYRAIGLTDEGAVALAAKGQMEVGFLRNVGNHDEAIKKFLKLGLEASRQEYASSHAGAEKSIVSAGSISETLSKYVGNIEASRRDLNKYWVFSLLVPVIETFHTNGPEFSFYLDAKIQGSQVEYVTGYEPYNPFEAQPELARFKEYHRIAP